MRERRALSRRGSFVAILALVAVVIGIVGTVVVLAPNPPASTGPVRPTHVAVVDATGALGPLFHPGVILGAASNSSVTLLAGIGRYDRTTGLEQPVLGEYVDTPSGPRTTNLTATFDPQFGAGGVYGAVWNGSAWMLGGQATLGGKEGGAAVAFSGGRITNLTPELRPYFDGGGIFAVGWNGSGWLLGGNASWGVSLVGLDGPHVTNLSSQITSHGRWGWIQLLAWNGSGWLLGGQGVFGTLNGSRFVDLDPGSPFEGQGVFAAGWDGTEWLVGGGGSAAVVVRASAVVQEVALPSGFSKWVSYLAYVPQWGWLLAGRGVAPGGGTAPELAAWPGTASSSVESLDALLPASFSGGEVQGGTALPGSGSGGGAHLLLVGDGSYNDRTGYGTGALAKVKIS